MATYFRCPFTGPSDLTRMLELVQRFPEQHVHVIDLPYRLCSWAFDFPENTALWLDERGSLVGWAALQTPFWVLDLALDPQLEPDLLPHMLAWAGPRAQTALGTAAGRPAWVLKAFSHQEQRRQIFEQAGFADQSDVGEDSWTQVLLAQALQAPVDSPALPPGFKLRPLNGAAEAQAYVDLHRLAFGSDNMTLEWRLRILQHPSYRPELDLVVEAPNGTLAAFCIGWLSESGLNGLPAAQIEPLGVHPNYMRRGLGKALILEMLRHMQALGVRQAYVETDQGRDAAIGLYLGAGFKPMKDILLFYKEFEEGEE